MSAGNAPSNSMVPEILPGDATDISCYGCAGNDTTDGRGATLPSFGFFGCAADAGFSPLHPLSERKAKAANAMILRFIFSIECEDVADGGNPRAKVNATGYRLPATD